MSPRSSINGPASSIKRSKSLLETHSEFTSSNSSPVTSEDRKNCPCAKTLHQLGNHIKCSRDHCDTSRGSSSNHGGCRESQCYLDAAWISTLVDNKYISPTDSSPESSPQQDDADLDSDIEPSRASSMLDRDFDLASLTFDESPKLPHPALPPVLSFSIAEQLAQTEDSHGHGHLEAKTCYSPSLFTSQSSTRNGDQLLASLRAHHRPCRQNSDPIQLRLKLAQSKTLRQRDAVLASNGHIFSVQSGPSATPLTNCPALCSNFARSLLQRKHRRHERCVIHS